MPFGINPLSLAKNELAKLDHGHGLEDARKALTAVEGTLGIVAAFFVHIDAQDVEELLSMLPKRLVAKLPPELVSGLKTELPLLPGQLAAAEQALKAVEAGI